MKKITPIFTCILLTIFCGCSAMQKLSTTEKWKQGLYTVLSTTKFQKTDFEKKSDECIMAFDASGTLIVTKTRHYYNRAFNPYTEKKVNTTYMIDPTISTGDFFIAIARGKLMDHITSNEATAKLHFDAKFLWHSSFELENYCIPHRPAITSCISAQSIPLVLCCLERETRIRKKTRSKVTKKRWKITREGKIVIFDASTCELVSELTGCDEHTKFFFSDTGDKIGTYNNQTSKLTIYTIVNDNLWMGVCHTMTKNALFTDMSWNFR